MPSDSGESGTAVSPGIGRTDEDPQAAGPRVVPGEKLLNQAKPALLKLTTGKPVKEPLENRRATGGAEESAG